MAETKKFLDQEGIAHLWSKINMQDYPNNEMLIGVIEAIDETKADKDTVPVAYREYIESVLNGNNPEEDEPTSGEVIYDLTLEIGKLSRTDGSERDEGDGLRTDDFIPVTPDASVFATYALSDSAKACFLCYDENYNLIKNWNADSADVSYSHINVKSGGSFDPPDGTSYIRAYWSTTDAVGTAQIIVFTYVPGNNISDSDFSLEYGRLSLNSGKPSPSTTIIRTVNYITCYGNALCYFYTGDYYFVALFYDADFNLIHGWKSDGKSYDYIKNEYIVAPENAAYVRLLCDTEGVDPSIPFSITVSNIDDVYANLSDEAEAATTTALAGRTAESFVFAALSDMHLRDCEMNQTVMNWTAYGLSEIQKRMQLDMVAFLGDFVDGSSTDSVEEGKAELKECRRIFYDAIGSTPSLWLAGNHDNNHYNGTELTGDELYSYLGANNVNVVTHYGNKQRIYGYRDFEEDKIRVIYLNTSDCSSSDTTSSSHVSAAQVKWLAEVALDFSKKSDANEWGIIVLSHMPLNWSSFTQLALTVLDAYILGLSTSVTADDEIIPIDYSSITNKAEIIAYFNGHTHNYRYRQIGMAHTWAITIPQVCIDRYNHYVTDNPGFAEFDAEGNPVYYYKAIGTNETTSFSLITVDRINKKITVAKYGAGYNRECIYGNSSDSDLSYQTISFVNSREGRSTYVFAYDSDKNLISDYFSGSAYTKVEPNSSYTFNSNVKYIRCFVDTSNTSGTFTLTYESGDSIDYAGTTGSLDLTTGLHVDEGRDFRSDFIELTFLNN